MGCVSGLRKRGESRETQRPAQASLPKGQATGRTLTGKRPSLGIPPPRLIIPGMDSRGMRARMGEGFLARLRLVRKESASRGSVGTPGTGALDAAAAAHRAE